MKRKILKYRNVIVVVLACAATALIATAAWATASLTSSQSFYSSFYSNQSPNPEEAGGHLSIANTARGHAPEPSTLALFGSGIFGMLISFVRKTYAATKRVFDILVSLVAIVVLSPLFLLTALLIKLTSRGPVIFKQVRVGRSGRLFEIYKFRTMKVDAEKETGAVWAQENDPRLIPCGRFLRKAHIDEIPQFFNVLSGEMSFIGPRPERPEFVKKFTQEICDYEKRLQIKPGITGLAQVWHRYDETIADVRKKIKYDLLYIKKVCLWTDLRITLRTVRVVLTGEGAR